jgi:hypothetical protein
MCYQNMKFYLVWVGHLVFTVSVLVNDTYQAMHDTGNPILFKF